MIEPKWLLVELIYIVASVGFIVLSRRAGTEWGRASIAGFGLAMLSWRLLAVIPSWWLFYAEGELQWGGQGCAALDVGCLKQAAKDTVVVIQNAVVLGGFVVAFLMYQKKFPKELGPGETKPEATGGYK